VYLFAPRFRPYLSPCAPVGCKKKRKKKRRFSPRTVARVSGTDAHVSVCACEHTVMMSCACSCRNNIACFVQWSHSRTRFRHRCSLVSIRCVCVCVRERERERGARVSGRDSLSLTHTHTHSLSLSLSLYADQTCEDLLLRHRSIRTCQHACHMRRRMHACHMRRRIHACHMRTDPSAHVSIQ